MTTFEKTVKDSHDWAIDRIHELSSYDIESAHAIHAEFSEWMNYDVLGHEVISLEYLGD